MAMAKSLANTLLFLCLIVASCEAKGRQGRIAMPAVPIIGDPNEKVFNVLQFGAKPGGMDCVENFMQAFRAACNSGGKARLVIPLGIFMLGPIIFQGPCQGPVTVEIQGTLKAITEDISAYTEDSWILFEKINGLVVTGRGTVDGQGASVWKYKTEGQDVKFPGNIKFTHVTNGVLRQITSVNPMGKHIFIVLCNNFRANGLKIFAPPDSPNTDGIHVSQSSLVKLSKNVISTGDDCIAIIHGCIDVKVKRIICGPGHGISIGSLGKFDNEKEVRGITVANCTLKGTQNGVRIKTCTGSPPGQASGIVFQDIDMDRVKNPIIVDQSYSCKNKGPSQIKISDVRYINIRGTSTSSAGVQLMCSPTAPCERLHLSDINLKYVGDKPEPFTSACTNAKATYAGCQLPSPCR